MKDYTWDNDRQYYRVFESWEENEGKNNLNLATGVGTFKADVLAALEGKNFWNRLVYNAYYNGTTYSVSYEPQILFTAGKSATTYATSNRMLYVTPTEDGFIMKKSYNYYFPNIRISVYNKTKNYECPRAVTEYTDKTFTYDYLNKDDEYLITLDMWTSDWSTHYSYKINSVFARGGKGDLGFEYSSAIYEQGESNGNTADIFLLGAEFEGTRIPASYTVNGNLWYKAKSNDNYTNIWYENFGKYYASESKTLLIDISSQLSTIRQKIFYPELVSEWDYEGVKYQLTLIDDSKNTFTDNHDSYTGETINKSFTVLPESGTFTVSEELQEKKAYLIKYNKNDATVTDKSVMKNDITKDEVLAKSRSAAFEAKRDGVIPEGIRRYEVDFVGYDFGDSIGPKVISRSAAPLFDYSGYVVDETEHDFDEGKAVLKAIGQHCNVWYMNNNDSADEVLTDAIAKKYKGLEGFQTVADKFDTFYEYETYFIGSNVPTRNYSDIIDLDDSVKIDIFIFDLYNDYTGQTGGTYGYFWAKDMVIKSKNEKSNEREMIYIDSAFLGQDPEYMFATLAHEFQHLLLYVNKWLNKRVDFPSWYTEMMSLGMEDLLQVACLGYTKNEAVSNRVYSFNGGYNAGFENWGGMNDSVYYSYANAAIFIDYLMKNYGGADLYYEIAHNSYGGEESITKALQALGYNETFDTVMMKMGQIIVNAFDTKPSESDITVNKSFTSTREINGETVTFKFNALPLANWSHDKTTKNYNSNDRYLHSYFTSNGYEYDGGPTVLTANKNFKNIYQKAITVNYLKTCPTSITLTNPGDGIQMAIYFAD